MIDLDANPTTGVLTWQEAGAPTNLIRPGTYRIGAVLNGFESQPVTFICPAGAANCNLQLSLRRLAQATLNLTSTGTLLPLGASVRLTGTTIGEVVLQAPANSSQVALPSLSTFDTSYAVEVRAAGFATRSSLLSALSCTNPPNCAGQWPAPGGQRLHDAADPARPDPVGHQAGQWRTARPSRCPRSR